MLVQGTVKAQALLSPIVDVLSVEVKAWSFLRNFAGVPLIYLLTVQIIGALNLRILLQCYVYRGLRPWLTRLVEIGISSVCEII